MTRKYNISLKALPILVCMENTALRYMSQESYSTWLRVVLYEVLDTPPHVVFSIHTCGSVLTYNIQYTRFVAVAHNNFLI